jgi:hypothetical protein
MMMMMKAFMIYPYLLSLIGMAAGASTTHIVPLAQEEAKKRGLLHRHLHECSCNSTTDLGGNLRRRRRSLAEAAHAMLERGLSENNVESLINDLGVTLRGGTSTTTNAPEAEEEEDVAAVVAATPEEEPPIADIKSSEEEVLALQVSEILEGAKADLGQVAVYTKHYQQANQDKDAAVNQDVLGLINIIFDFIVDLIQLVINVIESIISLIVNVSAERHDYFRHTLIVGSHFLFFPGCFWHTQHVSHNKTTDHYGYHQPGRGGHYRYFPVH